MMSNKDEETTYSWRCAAPQQPPEAALSTSSSSDTQKNNMIGKIAEDIIESASAKSNLPLLFSEEVTLVKPLLGSGGFCTVSAVRRIKLLSEEFDNDDGNHDATPATAAAFAALTETEHRNRSRLARRFADMERHHYTHRTPDELAAHQQQQLAEAAQRPPRVALKRLKSGLKKDRYEIGVKDLMSEVRVLSSIGNGHPNIINLYAIGVEAVEEEEAKEQEDADAADMNTSPHVVKRRIQFMLVDHLRATLKNMLYKWREARGLGIAEAMNLAQESTRNLWLERLVVLVKVTSAVAYLHSRNILHRDLNPDNIGFDCDDTVKLFDFGLARTIDPSRGLLDSASYITAQGVGGGGGSGGTHTPQDAYNLTGNTGTLRYMAPEVAQNKPYGTTADVYSLAILMHEVLSLYRPFADIPPTSFYYMVSKGGRRPALDATWPRAVQDLLSNMWDADPRKRPKSSQVLSVLEGILRGSDEDLFPARRGWFSGR